MGTRLVALAITGSSPRVIMAGRVTADPLDATVLRNPANTPARLSRTTVARSTSPTASRCHAPGVTQANRRARTHRRISPDSVRPWGLRLLLEEGGQKRREVVHLLRAVHQQRTRIEFAESGKPPGDRCNRREQAAPR